MSQSHSTTPTMHTTNANSQKSSTAPNTPSKAPLPSDMSKRPEITITPIPRSLSDLQNSFSPAHCLKALGLDLDLSKDLSSPSSRIAELASSQGQASQQPSPSLAATAALAAVVSKNN